MRRLIQIILLKPILWATRKFSSRPQPERIFPALTELFENIIKEPGKKGIVLKVRDHSRYIIFSDQHRGAKNGADDFMQAEATYLAALDYYFQNKFHFISLGDSEELWENTLIRVKKYNTVTFEAERKFLDQDRFYKLIGNHDLYWTNDPLAWIQLQKIYGKKLKVFEGVVLQWVKDNKQSTIDKKELDVKGKEEKTGNYVLSKDDCQLQVFLTHGHQGDASSDGNWFSKFFVSNIWAPLQAYLRINFNTPAYDEDKKTDHNHIMYEWSAQQKELILITGHTHQPVFASLTHLERLYKQLDDAITKNRTELVRELEAELKKRKREYKTVSGQFMNMKPSYFNSGCCCFRDGDCTGIEITHDTISLIKWSTAKGREVLEESAIKELCDLLK